MKLRIRWLPSQTSLALIVVTGICIWLGMLARVRTKQEHAATVLRRCGAKIGYNTSDPSLKFFRRAVGVSLVHIQSEFEKTRSLEQDRFEVDRAFGYLKCFPKLHSLTIDTPCFDNDHLRHLRGVANLDFLSLGSQCHVTLHGIEHLRGLRVRKLDIHGPGVDDDCMKVLSTLSLLDRLRLHGDGVTDDGMLCLANLSRLETLIVWTDGRTMISDEGLSLLRRALPNCDIVLVRTRD